MATLYGRHYTERYQILASLVDPTSSVLDICCGPGILYGRYLRAKNISYTGLDLNPVFIKQVIDYGATGKVQDVRTIDAFPEADFVIMQASLYHFLPDAVPILKRMLIAAKRALIVAESFQLSDPKPLHRNSISFQSSQVLLNSELGEMCIHGYGRRLGEFPFAPVFRQAAKDEATNNLSFGYSELFREVFDLVKSFWRHARPDVYSELGPAVSASFVMHAESPVDFN
jgi:SAM-dependent methyltransferase